MRYVAYLFVVFAFSLARADPVVDYFRAVNVDDAGTVKALLARGFDPNATDAKGQTGLHLALRDDSLKVAQALLAHARTRIDATNASDETPLMMAALRGQTEWTRKLLDRGAALNRPGWTPLHYAATGPEPKVVALLLERGARLEALSPNRTTPLMMAARYGPEDAVDLLLAKGASLLARNDTGLNAADFARLAGREELAKRLVAAQR
jgi:uncharacterized protein